MFNQAQQTGRTVQDVIADVTTQASSSIEAALLLRDVWEVLNITEYRSAQLKPAVSRLALNLIGQVNRQPFGGEEVLF